MTLQGERAAGAGGQRSAIRIVVVDDDASDRARIAGIVRSDVAPVEIEEVNDHVSFFRTLKTPDFDLVITEQDLHWSSGREVVTAVKSLDPSIPVIMVARAESEAAAAAALKEGVEAYIPKSGELAIRLRSSIRSALRRMEVESRAGTLQTRLQRLLDRVNVGVFRAAPDGRVLEANPAFLRLLGQTPASGGPAPRLDSLLVGEGVHQELIAQLEDEGQVRDFQVELRRADGSTAWVSLTESLQAVGGGEWVIDGLAEDVTEARKAQETLRKANEDYRAVFETTSAATTVLDPDLAIVMVNSAFEAISGAGRDEVEGKVSWLEFVAASDRGRLRRDLEGLLSSPRDAPTTARFDFAPRTGEGLHVVANLALLPGARRLVVSLQNVTDRQRAEEQLLHNAFHDGLTGLPNRLSLLDRMEGLLAESVPSEPFALLVLGLDRFRRVNDCLGHGVGDLLLQGVTRRIETALDGAHTVARCGGDTFAIVLHPVEGAEQAVAAAGGLVGSLAHPFTFGEHVVHCTVSVGVATSDTRRDAGAIFRDAEAAMYEAKRRGRDRCVVFEPILLDRAWHAFSVEGGLRKAISKKEFELRYQPIASLADGAVVGFESLLRWRSGGGLLAPDSFLDVAEATGLIVPIGHGVLRRACEQLKGWRSEMGAASPQFVSVNLSSRQLRDPDLFHQVEGVIREAGLAPSDLVLEVAEGELLVDADAVAEALSKLHALGVELCLDSFGAGSSALAYLHRFPFTMVKIDRAFLHGVGADQARWRLLGGVHALALHLGLEVIVEGVETKAQRSRLLDLGCALGQGELFSAPVDGAAADELLRRSIAPSPPSEA